MDRNLHLGSTVWIEHTTNGDLYYKVKLRLERSPQAIEICVVCHRGELTLIGHLIQTGILDEKVYAITRCNHCCALTVFSYHQEAHTLALPEEGHCE